MKIVSVTIAHNREHAISGALACVLPHVDECLIVDTGITDATLNIARHDADRAGVKLCSTRDPWQNDFSKARNRSLDFAAERDADWAILIDTDQRIAWGEIEIRAFLERGPLSERGYRMRSRNGTFARAQIFRIPRLHAYTGRTHEAYPVGGWPEIPTARVWGLPKTTEETHAKCTRDAAILLEDVTADPSHARAWFYLGVSLSNLNDEPAALQAYERCFHTSRWDAEAGWSAYRCAQLLEKIGAYEKAIDWCVRGLKRFPSSAELPALASWVSYRRGDHPSALDWALRALVMGDRERYTLSTHFRDLDAYYEGPAGLAALACGILGHTEEARRYETERLRLRALREEDYPGPVPPEAG